MRELSRIEQCDRYFARKLTSHESSLLRMCLRFVTLMGEGKSWLLMMLLLALIQAQGWFEITGARSFFASTLAAGLAWAVSTLLKRLIKRPRPFQALAELKHLNVAMKDDSMPSSHAATSFAFFVALLLAGHPLAGLVGIWSGLVAFSRLYLGVHYLSDVLVGIFLGTLCAYLKVFALGPQVF